MRRARTGAGRLALAVAAATVAASSSASAATEPEAPPSIEEMLDAVREGPSPAAGPAAFPAKPGPAPDASAISVAPAAPDAPAAEAGDAGAEALERVLAALRAGGPERADARAGDPDLPARDRMREALAVMAARRGARSAAIAKLVGKDLDLFTAKGRRKGKLVSFEGGALKLEQVFMINGRPAGSTRFFVLLGDLTPATLERLAPVDPPEKPLEWVAAALEAMAADDLDAAEAALGHAPGDELGGVLAARCGRTRALRREAAAREAWAEVGALAAKATSQAKARQAMEALEAFVKGHAGTDFVAAPGFAAGMASMKEELERLAMGLDPRVVRLFMGKVLTYDARTQVITLGYDFQTKEQTDDFVGSLWAPPGDHTGLTWRKGELRTFCKGTADRILMMPQFQSGTLTVRFDFRRIDTSKRNRFQVDVAFYGLESKGSTEKVMYRATQGGHFLLGAREDLASNLEAIPFREDGAMELSCQGQAVVVKENGKVMLQHTLPKANDHTGFWLGGGWDSGITFTKLEVSGRLDPVWLASALAPAPKTR